jgi:glucose/arabinose dehydrogenase
VALQEGQVHVIESDGTIAPEPFIDISDRIVVSFDQGLLGMAFHPGYAENGRFFLSYTRVEDGGSIISEFRRSEGDPNRAESGSERVIFGPILRETPMHNGGMIEFGPLDGHLYFTPGDGQRWDNGQDVSTPLGGMIRIDVDNVASGETYSIPPDNPWVGVEGASEELFAIGLRNPWRWSADPVTGRIIAGDVGERLREEVSIISRGANLGWNIVEGDLCFNPDNIREPLPDCDTEGLTPPIYIYAQTLDRRSVTGGYTYRGGALPDLVGRYLFGDFYKGDIEMLAELPSGEWEHSVLMTVPWANAFSWMTSFGVDEDGELLVLDARNIGHGGGSLYRLIYAADAVVISPIDDERVFIGDEYTGPTPTLFQEGTSSPGSAEFTWTLAEGPDGMGIDPVTGQVHWSVAGESDALERVSILVTSATASDEETWFLEPAVRSEAIVEHLLEGGGFDQSLDVNSDVQVDAADLVRSLE